MTFNEKSIVKDAARAWFGEPGYAVGHGPHLAPGEPAAEQNSFGEMMLVGRLHIAIQWLNPDIPKKARTTHLHFRSIHISTRRATNP